VNAIRGQRDLRSQVGVVAVVRGTNRSREWSIKRDLLCVPHVKKRNMMFAGSVEYVQFVVCKLV
jgi:hypothetical protein